MAMSMRVLFLRPLTNELAMKNDANYEDLVNIVRPYLPEDVNPDQIGPDSHLLEELNINSAHLVDIVLDVEDKYDIILENEDIDAMQTVKQAVELVQKKLAAKD